MGNFVNAAALRLVSGQDWIAKPSSCFACREKLAWHQNTPLFGWLRHAGRTACCGVRIPLRYFLVECAAGLILVSHVQGHGWQPTLVFLPFLLCCGVVFLTDLEACHIPDAASLGGTALGLVLVLADLPGLPSLDNAIIGGVAGFALIYGLNLVYRLWRGVDGMGLGDAKLMAMFGVWLGPVALLPVLFLASTAGALGGLLYIWWIRAFRPRNDWDDSAQIALPFGCFLVPAALLVHFWDLSRFLDLPPV